MNDKRIKKAVSLARRGNLEKAIIQVGQIVEKEPGHYQALFFYGTFLCQSGQAIKAAPILKRVCELDPTDPAAWTNYGLALMDAGASDESDQAFEKAISLSPHLREPHINLAHSHYLRGNYAKARALAQSFLLQNRDEKQLLMALAKTSRKLGLIEDAENVLKSMLEVDPNDISCLNELANLLAETGRKTEAIDCLEQILKLTPDDESTIFSLDVLRGKSIEAIPTAQVRGIFDEMAANFEHHLGTLGYGAPKILTEMLDTSGAPFAALDIGCGSGLIGTSIRPYCSRLVGIDLSEKMIRQARIKEVYDELVNNNGTDYLENSTQRFDLVLSCDTFPYIGVLDALFSTVSKRLNAGGQFLFTTEPLENGTYEIQQTGRFAHSRDYIAELSKEHGFLIKDCKSDDGRMEQGDPIAFDYFRLMKS